MTPLFALGIKFVLEIESNVWRMYRILCYKTNREALTVLCSVLKHFFRVLAASCGLYNRTDHSQGFSIC